MLLWRSAQHSTAQLTATQLLIRKPAAQFVEYNNTRLDTCNKQAVRTARMRVQQSAVLALTGADLGSVSTDLDSNSIQKTTQRCKCVHLCHAGRERAKGRDKSHSTAHPMCTLFQLRDVHSDRIQQTRRPEEPRSLCRDTSQTAASGLRMLPHTHACLQRQRNANAAWRLHLCFIILFTNKTYSNVLYVVSS